ncbi:MAG: hypothetical protein ACJAYU_001884 [Bradymonadia bacterium]
MRVNHVPRNVIDHRERLFLEKYAGESRRHVAMKLASWVTWFNEEMLVEKAVGQRYKPDLVRLHASGKPAEWIDCGRTSIRKLDHLTTHNDDCLVRIVKAERSELVSYVKLAAKVLRNPQRAKFYTFERGFIDAVAANLEGRHQLSATFSSGALYLDLDGTTFHSDLLELDLDLDLNSVPWLQ